MVEDLLRGFVGGEWIDDIDFSTLQKLSAEYVGEELRRRHGDTVWRVRRREDGLPLLVLLEFQSTADPDMALRVLEYTVLLYRELGGGGKRSSGGADAGALSALAALPVLDEAAPGGRRFTEPQPGDGGGRAGEESLAGGLGAGGGGAAAVGAGFRATTS